MASQIMVLTGGNF